QWDQRRSDDDKKLHAWEQSLPKCIGNVLKELNRTHYAYDERGNLSRKTEPNGVTWVYAYDKQNRLTEAKRYAKPPAANEIDRRERSTDGFTTWISGTAPFDVAASYTYDAFGRRVAKEVRGATGATELTVFTWDGDVLLMEERFDELPREYGRERKSANAAYQTVREDEQDAYSLPVAQRMHTLDVSHQWTRASLYLHEPGTFVPLARLDEKLVEPAFLATGTDGGFVQVPAKSRHATLFYQNDHLGTPQELLDESGKVVWLARYKAWGGRKPTPYGKTDPAEADNAIRFQGQYADDETGLTYNRYRYYDSSSGRYITQDPIGLAGGTNLYQYAPNPVQWIDPLGLLKLGYDKSSRTWSTPNGLSYGQGSRQGNRIKHVLEHESPNSNKPTHSVFCTCKRGSSLDMVDEAWKNRGQPLADDPGAYIVPMGRAVGTAGETSIKIITRPGTNEVITAYPVH
ncbi:MULTISPECIES: RHS repeat-associated core domain-containing protein, partial [Caballeronia]